MPFVYEIPLSTLEAAIVLLGCLVVVWAASPEWGVGVYLSTAYWTRTIMIGPLAHTWVLMGTMVGAAAVYKIRNPGKGLFPLRDRWIMIWMAMWWGWMLLLVFLFDPPEKMPLYRSVILYTIAPLPIILLFANDTRRARSFALSYLLCTMLGGWAALSVLHVPIRQLLSNPTLDGTGIVRLGIANYHWFAYGFGISLILILALFQQARSKLIHGLLVLAAMYCAYFLLLAGDRQTIAGLTFVLPLFLVWALRRTGTSKLGVVLLTGLAVLTGVLLYRMAPDLVLRHESVLAEVTYGTAQRSQYWQRGLKTFMGSPVWGAGFSEYYSHNFFVGTLADQGLIGMGFLIGFLVFFCKQARGVWAAKGCGATGIWRMAFVCVALFGLVHAQASGNPATVWHLYWSSAFLWWLTPLALHQRSYGGCRLTRAHNRPLPRCPGLEKPRCEFSSLQYRYRHAQLR